MTPKTDAILPSIGLARTDIEAHLMQLARKLECEATELLDALKALQDAFPSGRSLSAAESAAWDKARAAIAKAEE
jgi:hypothetical protein